MKINRLEPYEDQALDLIVKGIKLVLEKRENKTILNFSSSIEETNTEVSVNTKMSSADSDY
ncbi:hypothetical protein MNQ98_09345 [Paenibacillus sp. N3/727]|uniref:hypothetical protein n=1 Tax=Paenibacillus sp. N3/727 TaxID=2925845 RepID=UPI001F534017|nr:hypothetical protein [Paenibacillus sp. N3/727]UNK20192.1 hypothetical protein MNQ98_09345 [Paenibacillus sp. N3/727]